MHVRTDAPARRRRLLATLLRARLALVAGILAAGLFNVLERPIDQGLFVATALTAFILVLAHQFATRRENARLKNELRERSHDLEATIEERTQRLATLHDLAAGLCGAASAAEVCDVGLRSLYAVVSGARTCVLYLLDGDRWLPHASHPAVAEYGDGPCEGVRGQLSARHVVHTIDPDGLGTIWVPASARGQVYGCLAVRHTDLHQTLDAQFLATLGAEFGLAFEDRRRCEAVARDEARLRSLVQNSSQSITVVDADYTVRYHSPAAQQVFEDDPGKVVGTRWPDLLHEDDRAQAAEWLAEVARSAGATAVGEWRRRAHGGWRYVETLATNLLHDPNVGGIVLTSRDVSERKALEQELRYQALHDPLTSLANRALFHDRVEHALVKSRRTDRVLAVVLLDVDNFKTVNDSLGHAAGDQLLIGIAARVSSNVRAGDSVARLGGDEFGILLEDVHNEAEVVEVARRIELTLREPFHVQGKDVFVTASTGIALSTTGSGGADEVVRNADVAMYMAKERGKDRHVTFEPDMHAAVVRRLELEADLRQALRANEFVLHYQPLFDLRSGRMASVEALVRWRHPRRGLVSPAEFIPIAEDTGLIVPLGRWVLRQACRDVRDWQQRLPATAPATVNVNLSARQLQEIGLVEDVATALRDSGLPPRGLALEITESALMHDPTSAVARLRELKQLGVQIAIDDFGTGYSSLSYLQQFPVDTLKIDKSFIEGVGREPERGALASAIIDLAKTLGLKTVAEGIEHAAQAEQLTHLGCDVGQGYHFARPMERERLEATLAHATAIDTLAA